MQNKHVCEELNATLHIQQDDPIPGLKSQVFPFFVCGIRIPPNLSSSIFFPMVYLRLVYKSLLLTLFILVRFY